MSEVDPKNIFDILNYLNLGTISQKQAEILLMDAGVPNGQITGLLGGSVRHRPARDLSTLWLVVLVSVCTITCGWAPACNQKVTHGEECHHDR